MDSSVPHTPSSGVSPDFEAASLLSLNRIFGYEPKVSRSLIRLLGSASAVFCLSPDELSDIFGPFSRHAAKIRRDLPDSAFHEIARLKEEGGMFIGISSPDYPAVLLECEDAPVGLYYLGDPSPREVFGRPCVSVVGTRDISPYGRDCCVRAVSCLAPSPQRPLVVSGLAIGVDITAHLAALENALPTVAVLPTGADAIYPRRHTSHARRIAATSGCALVTDFPPGTSPQACTFLRRNRIIAGLSSSTILVESREKGGGMMTASLASGYGRDVFAVPGRLDDIRSRGCNILIRRNVAEAITDFDSLPDMLGLGRFDRKRLPSLEDVLSRVGFGGGGRDDELLRFAKAVRSRRGITLDELCEVLGRSYQEVCAAAGRLESEGIISVDLLQRCCIVPEIG